MKIYWLSCVIVVTLASVSTAYGRVTARPSRTSLAENETLVLTVTAESAGFPDLSPLEQDFAILNRGVSTSRRSINGRTSQRTNLTLTLMPKRSGNLTIPAIRFGDQASQPLTIRVTAASGGISEPQQFPNPGPSSMGAPYYPSPAYSFNYGFDDWTNPQGTGPRGAPPDWTGAGYGAADPGRTPETPLLSAQPDPAPAPGGDSGGTNYWPWLTGVAVTGWLATSLLLLRRRYLNRQTPEAFAEPAPTKKVPIRSKAEIEEDVEQAYARNDRFAAKAALLQWGAAVWPDDPPTNLSRLAARCPPQLQRRILKLEEAIYSPQDEVAWSQHAVWEQLRHYQAAHPEDPKAAPGLVASNP
jgi:hypothetical protein